MSARSRSASASLASRSASSTRARSAWARSTRSSKFGPVGADRLDRGVEPKLRATLGLLGLARCDALLGHALTDDLARERGRVGVANDDQDARQPTRPDRAARR